MNRSKCPHCRAKLGNFLYADACPYCREELKHNTNALLPAPKNDPQREQPWAGRMFFRLLRLLES